MNTRQPNFFSFLQATWVIMWLAFLSGSATGEDHPWFGRMIAPEPKAFSSPKIEALYAAWLTAESESSSIEETKAVTQKALDQHSEDVEVRVWANFFTSLAMLRERNQPAKALHCLKAAEQDAAGDPDLSLALPSIHYMMAETYLQVGPTDEDFKQEFPGEDAFKRAVSSFLATLSEAPDWKIAGEACVRLAEISDSRRVGDSSEKIPKILNDILEKHKDSKELAAGAKCGLAVIRWKKGNDPSGAKEMFKQVMEDYPGARGYYIARSYLADMEILQSQPPDSNQGDSSSAATTGSNSVPSQGCCASSSAPGATGQPAQGDPQPSVQATGACTCGKPGEKSSCGPVAQPDSCCAPAKNPSATAEAKGSTSPQAQATDFSDNCGVRALARVMEAQGAAPERKELAALAKVDAGGATMLGLKQAAEAKGFTARGLKATAEELKTLQFPLVAYMGGNHFVALMRVEGDAVVVVDGEQGEKSVAMEEFGKSWNGELLEITKP